MNMLTRLSISLPAIVSGLLLSASAYALDVNIAKDLPSVTTVHDGKEVKIQRIQDQDHVLTGGYTKTSRKCPPFCIQPMHAAPNVNTVGELEVIEFIRDKVNQGTGVLIDARTQAWYKQGTIPGSTNIPFNTFSPDSSDMVKTAALTQFGITHRDGSGSLLDSFQRFLSNNPNMSSTWDFSKAKELVLWCNGMWCGQSPHAIHGLLSLGYPAEKIHYYRGGMQSWVLLGLTVVKPN